MSSDTVPSTVVNWAATHGAKVYDEFVAGDPEYTKKFGPESSQFALSTPTRKYVFRYRDYDLTTDTIKDDPAGRAAIKPTGTYVSRVVIGGQGVDASAELSVSAHDKVSVDSFGDTAHWLAKTSDDLSSYTLVEDPAYGAYAWLPRTDELIALDSTAEATVGDDPINVSTFVTAAARRNAEAIAVARLEGPVAGGAPSLFPQSTSGEEAWQSLVHQGLAVPDDMVWTPEKGTYAEQLAVRKAADAAASPSAKPLRTTSTAVPSNTASVGRIAGEVAAVLVVGLLIVLLVRRRRVG